jgi:hypothetical protein
VGEEGVQEGGTTGEAASPYTLRTGVGEFAQEGDICPAECGGILYRSEMGLDCDTCNFAIVDPNNFKKEE